MTTAAKNSRSSQNYAEPWFGRRGFRARTFLSSRSQIAMIPIHIDFETFNKKPIKGGASRYAMTAEILCLSYSLDDGITVKHWVAGEPFPQDLFDAIKEGRIVYAHNATFEINVWRKVMVGKYGWPEIADNQWRCTMAEAMAVGLPAGLEKIALGMGLDVQKDMEGRRLMQKMAKPRKPTKKDASVRHNSPEQLARLTQYCDQDVRSEIAVFYAVPRLSPREVSVFHYDQKVNRRGICIDRDLARSALTLWEIHTEELNAELKAITGGKVGTSREVKNMVEFLESEGVECHQGLKKEGVSEYFEQDLTPTARRVLEIRQELALSSISKYESMLRSVEPDNRVRGCLQYHAAQTGRWGGRLIQVQNFPRGVLDDSEIEYLIYLVKKLDIKRLKMLMPLGDILSSLLRSAVMAAPGKKLIVCDFNAIEARGLAWSAGEKWLLDAFKDNQDPYCGMASDIYARTITKKDKAERFLGKTCLAADTRVITSSGVKAIVDVTLDDLLWDGLEWVKHSGLIYQGEKQVITAAGLTSTPDHGVLTLSGWQPWENVFTDLQSFQSGVLFANLPLLLTNVTDGSSTRLSDAHAVGREQSTEQISTTEELQDAILAVDLKDMQSNTGNTNHLCSMTTTGQGCSTDYHRPSVDATTQETEYTPVTEVAGYSYAICGETIGRTFLSTSKELTDGTYPRSTWTEQTTTKGMNPETLDFLLSLKTQETNGESTALVPRSRDLKRESENSKVYDLVNAGPRNRFTVVTNAGLIIVHNCVLGCGYSMGADTFQRKLIQDVKTFGMDVDTSSEFCQAVVKSYRTKNSRIVRHWYETENAAVRAVKEHGEHQAGPYIYFVKDDWLYCRMPCGRNIGYYMPVLIPGKFDKQQIKYLGVSKTGSLSGQTTYSGKLVENNTQAVCRDILVDGLARLEKNGYKVVMHVHDEAVCEVDEDFGSVKEMEQILSETPSWAKGFPVAAEGFQAKRYRK